MKLDAFYRDTQLGTFKLIGYADDGLLVDRYHFLPLGAGWALDGRLTIDKEKFKRRMAAGLLRQIPTPA